MQLASIEWNRERHWGVVEGETIRLAPQALGQDLRQFIERHGGPVGRDGSLTQPTADWPAVPRDEVRWLAPLPEPRRNLICLGLNYRDHAAEVQGVGLDEASLPEHPMFFTKATTTVTGPYANVVLDPTITQRLDWEVELAVVIGQGGRHIAPDQALDHVIGYTVVNDLSARDLQKRHGQFFLGKSMDASAPMGPCLVTADEIADPHALALSCSVNGQLKQSSSTNQLIFGIPEIIEVLSRVMTLLPGDILVTGTPGGVGFVRNPREFLQAGDCVECTVDGVGTIRNRLVSPLGDTGEGGVQPA